MSFGMNIDVCLAEPARLMHAGGRRHRLDGIELGSLDAFNLTLRTVCPTAQPVQADEVATIGRAVLCAAMSGHPDNSIAQAMAAVPMLAGLQHDPDWNLSAELQLRLAVLMAYIEEPEDLIPDHLPLLGWLDDALLVDVLTRDIAGELHDFEDFRSYRLELALRRRQDPAQVHADPDEWLHARCRSCGQARLPLRGGFLRASAPSGFRVH